MEAFKDIKMILSHFDNGKFHEEELSFWLDVYLMSCGNKQDHSKPIDVDFHSGKLIKLPRVVERKQRIA